MRTVPDSQTLEFGVISLSWLQPPSRDKDNVSQAAFRAQSHTVWGACCCGVPSSPWGLWPVRCEVCAPQVPVWCLQGADVLVSWEPLGPVGCRHSQAVGPSAPLPISNPGCFSAHADTAFGTPPGYGCAADRAEEQRRHQDGLPYIDDSPSSSPHLGSKGRGGRDALASGALESTKAVSPRPAGPV